jgi:hypothetical protein
MPRTLTNFINDTVIPQSQNRTGGQVTADIQRRIRGGEDFGTIIQKDAIARTRPFEARLEAARGRFARDVADTSKERGRLRGGLSSAIAQRFGRVGANQQQLFAGNLDQLTRKARARQQISQRGEAAIENQQLKDRISIARQGLKRRGLALRAAGASARQRLGLDTAVRGAKDATSAAFAGAAGGIVGGLAAGAKDLFRSGVDPVAADIGTAGADFLADPNRNPFDATLDPANVGTSFNTVFG